MKACLFYFTVFGIAHTKKLFVKLLSNYAIQICITMPFLNFLESYFYSRKKVGLQLVLPASKWDKNPVTSHEVFHLNQSIGVNI